MKFIVDILTVLNINLSFGRNKISYCSFLFNSGPGQQTCYQCEPGKSTPSIIFFKDKARLVPGGQIKSDERQNEYGVNS